MKSVGFGFQQGRIRVVELEYNNPPNPPTLVSSTSIVIDHTLPLPDLMDRYRRDFHAILTVKTPDLVSARFNYESDSIASAHSGCMPEAILALVCHTLNVTFKEYTLQSLRSPGPFGFPAKSKTTEQIDNIYGANPPYWDKMQKETLLAAWKAFL